MFTEDATLLSSLTDERFRLVTEADTAQIIWSLGENRSQLVQAGLARKALVNEFPKDSVLLMRESL